MGSLPNPGSKMITRDGRRCFSLRNQLQDVQQETLVSGGYVASFQSKILKQVSMI